MIQAADNAPSRAAGLAVLQQMELLIPIGIRQRSIHEVVRILQERLIIVGAIQLINIVSHLSLVQDMILMGTGESTDS